MREIKRDKRGRYKKGTSRPDMVGENNPMWKGKKAGYGSKHDWIKKWYGEPSFCEECDTEKASKFDWANLSGKYLRDRSDWKRLCRSCHHLMDDRGNKTWKTRTKKHGNPCKECGEITTSKHQLCPPHAKKMYNYRRNHA